MTCIVGIIDQKTKDIYIGGDSAGVAGYRISVRKDPKVFVKDANGGFIYGFTTSFRMGDILRYSFVEPAFPEGSSVALYMRTTYIDALRTCFREKGFLGTDTKDQTEVGGTFLIGFRGNLFTVETDYQIGEHEENYSAVGSGCDLAMGSLYTTQTMEYENGISLAYKDRILVALEAAAKFNAGVRAPFIVEKLPFEKPEILTTVILPDSKEL